MDSSQDHIIWLFEDKSEYTIVNVLRVFYYDIKESILNFFSDPIFIEEEEFQEETFSLIQQ